MSSFLPLLRRLTRWLAALLTIIQLAACHSDTDTETPAALPAAWSASGKGRIDIEGGVIRLAARRDGVVAQTMVEEGERVVAGQVLAELDSETARRQIQVARIEARQAAAALEQARVDVQAAKREAQRLHDLAGNDSVARQDIDQAGDRLASTRAALEAAEAALAGAQARITLGEREIEERRIVAPLPGLIAQRSARPGNGVSTLNVTPLFVFVPDVARIARIELEEHLLPAIHRGQSVEIVLDADHRRRWPGTVLRIGQLVAPRSPSDDPAERQDNRVIEIVVAIDAPEAVIGQRVIARFARDPAHGIATGSQP